MFLLNTPILKSLAVTEYSRQPTSKMGNLPQNSNLNTKNFEKMAKISVEIPQKITDSKSVSPLVNKQ